MNQIIELEELFFFVLLHNNSDFCRECLELQANTVILENNDECQGGSLYFGRERVALPLAIVLSLLGYAGVWTKCVFHYQLLCFTICSNKLLIHTRLHNLLYIVIFLRDKAHWGETCCPNLPFLSLCFSFRLTLRFWPRLMKMLLWRAGGAADLWL